MNPNALQNILSPSEGKLITSTRKALEELLSFLRRENLPGEDFQALTHSLQQLDDFFMLVVVGEFNAGKSALINALLGEKILPEGVTPTTTQINILRSKGAPAPRGNLEDVQILEGDSPFLAETSIVDTPGTNAVIKEHQEITTRFIPRADLILFITSADRPFTESERQFLRQIRDWKKKVILILNKIDLLGSPQELEQVKKFITSNVEKLLDFSPRIFTLSAQQAYLAKQGQDPLWPTSQFQPLEEYIRETLEDSSRLRLKLLNPLGVADHLTETYREYFTHRLKVLQQDRELIQDVEHQLDLYRQDMLESFQFRLSDIDGLLVEMENRGLAFFEEHLRLARIFDLINKEKIQRSFEKQVIADVPAAVESRVTRIIDWIVEANLKQWQAVKAHLADSVREHQGRVVGGSGDFQYDRERYIQSIQRQAQRVIGGYNQDQEARQIANRAQAAVAAAAALEVSAVGLGTVVSLLASTMAADVTGILIAGMIAALGFVIIPARRRKAKQEMREKVLSLRNQLTSSLQSHFKSEIDRSLQDIKGTFAPYARFIHSEWQQHQSALAELESIHARVKELAREAENLDS